MKNILSFFVCPFFILTVFSIGINAQDTLSIEDLTPYTYTFDIENGKLTGAGGRFLMEEVSKAQFTMIGEYHSSLRISELTEAMIPVLDHVGYKTLVLEVGPTTGQFLNGLTVNTEERLKEVNEKYLIKEEDGYINTPIPFFENVEDASFLSEAKKNKWNVIGIDQEFIHGYKMLMEMMFEHLNDAQKSQHLELYKEAGDSLDHYYAKDIDGEMNFSIAVANSAVINKFLFEMSIAPKNQEIIEALKASNHIYRLNAERQWFENNSTRIKYMKHQLRAQLAANNFNLENDKLLIKMGGYHLSKGFSPLGLYEVGNTLNEIAEFNGHSALNITFSNRFYMEDGAMVDILNSKNKYDQRLKDLNRMGKKDEWVVIDLRPMVKGHFYRPVKFKFNENIEGLVKKYDLLIIPKIEMDPTPNYDLE